jgi:hypothetical protein
MYCTKCGTNRPDGQSVCPACGTIAPSFDGPQKIENYLVQSILVTLCCCVPAGIVAIVYAAQVNTKLAARDVAGAHESARLAKLWSWVGFGLGAAGGIVYAILAFIGAVADAP